MIVLILNLVNSDGTVIIDNMNIFTSSEWTIWATPTGGDIYFQNGTTVENKASGEAMYVQDDNGNSTAEIHFNNVLFIAKNNAVISGPAACGTTFEFAKGTFRTSGSSSQALFTMNKAISNYLTGVTAYVNGNQ